MRFHILFVNRLNNSPQYPAITRCLFLKPLILFSAKSMILVSVILHFSSLQIADALTSGHLDQTDDPGSTQFLANHYDYYKQYNMRQFNLTTVQKCTQASSAIEFTRTFPSVFVRAKAKRSKITRCSAIFQINRNLCAKDTHHKRYKHEHMDWHTNFVS